LRASLAQDSTGRSSQLCAIDTRHNLGCCREPRAMYLRRAPDCSFESSALAKLALFHQPTLQISSCAPAVQLAPGATRPHLPPAEPRSHRASTTDPSCCSARYMLAEQPHACSACCCSQSTASRLHIASSSLPVLTEQPSPLSSPAAGPSLASSASSCASATCYASTAGAATGQLAKC